MDKLQAENTHGLILASASPRRRELLKELVPEYRVEPSRFEEIGAGLSARDTVAYFAEGKAREVYSRFPRFFVLGADTVVALDGKILGKPKDAEDAKDMLRRLSGRVHSVYTGVCLIGEGYFSVRVAETKVEFFPLEESLIERYVESGLPLDKAGAYGIQDGYELVKKYEGSYTNVVGLPAEDVRELLNEAYGRRDQC